VLAIAFGALIAGAGDLQFSFIGYCLGMLSCLSQGNPSSSMVLPLLTLFLLCWFTAGYLLFVAKREEESGMSTFGLLYYNCALSLPFVLLFMFGSGESSAALAYPQLWSLNFIVRVIDC